MCVCVLLNGETTAITLEFCWNFQSSMFSFYSRMIQKKKIVFMQKKNPLTTLQCLTLAQYRSSCTGFFLPNIDERSIIIDKDNFLRNERKENSLLSSSVLLTIHGQINSNWLNFISSLQSEIQMCHLYHYFFLHCHWLNWI